MASNREQQYYQEIPPEIQEAGFNFGTTISPPLINTSTTSEAPFRPLERCNSCGTLKRQSTSSLSYLQEPSSKRVSLHPSATATGDTSSGGNHHFVSEGFQELPVANCTSSPVPPPLSSSNVKQNVLDRSISDITSYMGIQEIGEFKANVLGSPENSKIIVVHLFLRLLKGLCLIPLDRIFRRWRPPRLLGHQLQEPLTALQVMVKKVPIQRG